MKSKYLLIIKLLALTMLATSLALEGSGQESQATKETQIDEMRFTHPAEVKVSKVAGEPLVKWPICADVALDGSLYIAESSGSNAPVQEQLKAPTHRVIRLIDDNRDGVYDRRVVFAEKLMFPEGILCIDGGVLVAAPPQIWKLEDRDGDGVSETREVWFDGKTLTGCANDLHGPFRGPDGWIYWCKGAFAEQTHDTLDGRVLKTTASHIFRRRLEGGKLESVMTGGMDNPVEVAFDQVGNIFFTSTFVQHPAGGRRDGLMHAVYGGLYGKDHGVLANHPYTGELMPVMTHLGPAAPSGLMRIDSELLGPDYQDGLVATHFNLQKVTLHRLEANGAGLKTVDSDLLRSDRVDFHPTDVLHDHDGSVLVVDTGGWYRLCCPTSHLDQSAASGGIYRLRGTRGDVSAPTKVDSSSIQALSENKLFELLKSQRLDDRLYARHEIVRRDESIIPAVMQLLNSAQANSSIASELMWCLCQMKSSAKVTEALTAQLAAKSSVVRQIALQSLSTRREGEFKLVGVDAGKIIEPQELRLSLQWLGRMLAIGKGPEFNSVVALLSGLPDISADRILEHSLIYCVIESGNEELALRLLDSKTNFPAYCKALHALSPEKLPFERVFSLLQKQDGKEVLEGYSRRTALWLISRSNGWDEQIAENLPQVLLEGKQSGGSEFAQLIALCLSRPAISDKLAKFLGTESGSNDRSEVLGAIKSLPPSELSATWLETLLAIRKNTGEATAKNNILEILRRSKLNAEQQKKVTDVLLADLAGQENNFDERLGILATLPGATTVINDSDFTQVKSRLKSTHSVSERALAIEALRRAVLSRDQKVELARSVEDVGPMEVSGLLVILESSHEPELNRVLVDALVQSPVASAIPNDRYQRHFSMHPPEVRDAALASLAKLDSTLEERQQKLNSLLQQLKPGSPLKGLQVFHSAKAACGACHEIGYRGGNIGPDLSKVGSIRTRRDLVEAILFPSVSFVRSYEPVAVLTKDGEVLNGLAVEESAEGITLIQGAEQRLRLSRDEIEEIRPGKTSVMPGGLDQVLTIEEFSDLIALLESSR